MPWVYPQEVRQDLPNGGKGVTEARMVTLISDGESMTTLGDTNATETILGKRAVREYARAEAMKIMRSKGDPITPEEIRLAEETADKFAASYRMSTATTLDDP